jgi:hypothetical protein
MDQGLELAKIPVGDDVEAADAYRLRVVRGCRVLG